VKLTRRDLSALSEIDQKLALEAAAAELQASLKFDNRAAGDGLVCSIEV
jgi:hypothetical protein